jgi:hypothetical protein
LPESGAGLVGASSSDAEGVRLVAPGGGAGLVAGAGAGAGEAAGPPGGACGGIGAGEIGGVVSTPFGDVAPGAAGGSGVIISAPGAANGDVVTAAAGGKVGTVAAPAEYVPEPGGPTITAPGAAPQLPPTHGIGKSSQVSQCVQPAVPTASATAVNTRPSRNIRVSFPFRDPVCDAPRRGFGDGRR